MSDSLDTSEREFVELTPELRELNTARVEAFAAQASVGHLSRLVDELRGQMLVISTLLGEAIEVVKTIEAESTDEADKLRTLIHDSEAARIAIAREQLATWCTKVCSGEGCECERKENDRG